MRNYLPQYLMNANQTTLYANELIKISSISSFLYKSINKINLIILNNYCLKSSNLFLFKLLIN